MPDATAVPGRRHVTIIELDRGYTVSMAQQILACESLHTVHDAVVLLLAARVPQPDPPQPRPEPEPEPVPSMTSHAVVDQDDSARDPVDDDEDEEQEEEEEEEIEEEEEEPDEEPEDPQQQLPTLVTALARESYNRARLYHLYQDGVIDQIKFRDGLVRYGGVAPSEVESYLAQVQGLDPVRFNGVGS